MNSEVIFVEQKTGNKIKVKDYIALNVEQGVRALRDERRDYKIYKKYRVNTHDVFFAIKTNEKGPPKIFVLKRFKGYQKLKDFKNEVNTFKKVASMQSACRRRLVEGTPQEHHGVYWIVMEYYDGSIADLVDSGGLLTEAERRQILTETMKAVSCLYFENLAYVDMKIDQILYRYQSNKLEVKLGDLEVVKLGGKDGIKLTHRGPVSSPKVNKQGFFHKGDDSAIAFGILMLMIELWLETTDKRGVVVSKLYRKNYNNPNIALPQLKKLMPHNVYNITKMLYNEWETIKIPELRKIILNEFE